MSNLILLKDLAKELNLDKSYLLKYLKKNNIRYLKIRTAKSLNQQTIALGKDEADIVKKMRNDNGYISFTKNKELDEFGYFYLIQLIPEYNKNRIKMGFTNDVKYRVLQHRTSAPTLNLLKFWSCKRSWEKTIIDCLSNYNCKLILNEVFETENIDILIEYADKLFLMFPECDSKIKI